MTCSVPILKAAAPCPAVPAQITWGIPAPCMKNVMQHLHFAAVRLQAPAEFFFFWRSKGAQIFFNFVSESA